jgi:hypothetical protein
LESRVNIGRCKNRTMNLDKRNRNSTNRNDNEDDNDGEGDGEDDESLELDPELKQMSKNADAILDAIRNEVMDESGKKTRSGMLVMGHNDDDVEGYDTDDEMTGSKLLSGIGFSPSQEEAAMIEALSTPYRFLPPSKIVPPTSSRIQHRGNTTSNVTPGSTHSSISASYSRTSSTESASLSASATSKQSQSSTRLGSFLDERKLRKKTVEPLSHGGSEGGDDWSIDEDAASLNSELDRLNDITIQLSAALHSRELDNSVSGFVPIKKEQCADFTERDTKADVEPDLSLLHDSARTTRDAMSDWTTSEAQLDHSFSPPVTASPTALRTSSMNSKSHVGKEVSSSISPPEAKSITVGEDPKAAVVTTFVASPSTRDLITPTNLVIHGQNETPRIANTSSSAIDRRKERWKKNYQASLVLDESASQVERVRSSSDSPSVARKIPFTQPSLQPTLQWKALLAIFASVLFILVASMLVINTTVVKSPISMHPATTMHPSSTLFTESEPLTALKNSIDGAKTAEDLRQILDTQVFEGNSMVEQASIDEAKQSEEKLSKSELIKPLTAVASAKKQSDRDSLDFKIEVDIVGDVAELSQARFDTSSSSSVEEISIPIEGAKTSESYSPIGTGDEERPNAQQSTLMEMTSIASEATEDMQHRNDYDVVLQSDSESDTRHGETNIVELLGAIARKYNYFDEDPLDLLQIIDMNELRLHELDVDSKQRALWSQKAAVAADQRVKSVMRGTREAHAEALTSIRFSMTTVESEGLAAAPMRKGT